MSKGAEGIGRCGEQQQDGVLKKNKNNRAAGRTRGESNAQRHQIATRHTGTPPGKTPFSGPPGTPPNYLISSFVCVSEAATPPDPLYSHYVCNRHVSYSLQLVFVIIEEYLDS